MKNFIEKNKIDINIDFEIQTDETYFQFKQLDGQHLCGFYRRVDENKLFEGFWNIKECCIYDRSIDEKGLSVLRELTNYKIRKIIGRGDNNHQMRK